MSIDFGADGNAMLESDMVRMAVLGRVATDIPARFWIGGINDLSIPPDNVETDSGAIYTGLGDVVGMGALSQLINGQADMVQITVSGAGVDVAGMQLLNASLEETIYRRFNLGLALFDDDWQQLGQTVWLAERECSTIDAAREAGVGGDPDVRTVSLGVGSTFTARRRPRVVNFTDAHQRRISASDRFFDRISTYSAGSTIKW